MTYMQKWREKNPGYGAAYMRERRAKHGWKYGLKGKWSGRRTEKTVKILGVRVNPKWGGER